MLEGKRLAKFSQGVDKMNTNWFALRGTDGRRLLHQLAASLMG